MGQTLDSINAELAKWIKQQEMFWVASAPLDAQGHVNCSPKGLDSFRILDEHRVCYLDLTGSGIETIAHVRENARLTIMFHAFNGPPKIVRLQGKGSVHLPGDQEFDALMAHFEEQAGVRSIIELSCTRISSSCGFGVPLYEFKGQRPTMHKWAEKKGDAGIAAFQQEHNRKSIDGLDGI